MLRKKLEFDFPDANVWYFYRKIQFYKSKWINSRTIIVCDLKAAFLYATVQHFSQFTEKCNNKICSNIMAFISF